MLIVAAAVGRGPALSADQTAADFPPELVDFVPYKVAPLLAGAGQDTWDRNIRERGYILREGDTWHLGYTGYNDARMAGHFVGERSVSQIGLDFDKVEHQLLADRPARRLLVLPVRHGQ
jgi:hypothetical protein